MMFNSENIDNQVLAWYQDHWNQSVLSFATRPEPTPETSLSTGEFAWSWEDAEGILIEYFDKFSVDKRNFSFTRYWPNEQPFSPLNILGIKDNSPEKTSPLPLTLSMLIESAKIGYWLYD